MNSKDVFFLARATIFLVAFLLAVTSFAEPLQWDPDGVALRQGAGIGAYSVAKNSQDFNLVVWCDLRNGSDDIFAQLISPAGVPQWTAGGVLVVEHPAEQVNPVVVAVSDGWIIFWIDHRDDSGISTDPAWGDVYAQKLNGSGQRQWSSNDYTGVAVDVNTSSRVLHSEPLIAVADGSGGALVAWTDDRGDYAVLAQRISGSGQVMWASPLSVADTMRVNDFSVNGTGDDAGNLFLSWNDWSLSSWGIRVVKISPDGQRLWGGAGKIIYTSFWNASDNGRPQLCPDNAGGCFVAWTDRYSSYDVHLQRLNAAGDTMFGADGIAVCEAPGAQDELALAPSYNGSTFDGCLLAWRDWRDSVTAVPQIYVQKVSPNGQLQWTGNGVCAATAPCGGSGEHYRGNSRVISDQTGGMVCVWRDALTNEILTGDLYASRIDINGVKTWGGDCTPVWVSPAAQTSPLPVAGMNGPFVYWIDIAGGASTLRYQHLDRTLGTATLAAEGVQLCNGICGLAQHPQTLMLEPGRYATVWEDTRGWTSRVLYYQIFNEDGESEGLFNGRPLVSEAALRGHAFQTHAQLCPDGHGGFFVTYVERQSDGNGIERARLAHVNAVGDVVSPAAGAAVHADYLGYDDFSPHCLADGSGGCWIAWARYDLNFIGQIFVQRMNAGNSLAWNEPLQFRNILDADRNVLAVVAGADESMILVWTERNYVDHNDCRFVATNIQKDGTVAWQLPIAVIDGYERDGNVLADGAGGFYFVLRDLNNLSDNAIFAQHVCADGQMLWPAAGLPVAAEHPHPLRVQIASGGDGTLVIGWTALHGNGEQIFLQKLDPSGNRLWENAGRVVCPDAVVWYDFRLLPDAGDGLFVCWRDLRGMRSHIYATHLDADAEPVADPYWTDGGGLVSTSLDAQEEPVLCADGFGGMIVTYVDNKGIEEVVEPPQIYVQRVFDNITAAPESPVETPLIYALHQNYPNPFNPATEITFDLAHNGHATLEVFDLLGRKVMTLVNGTLPSGAHHVTVDGAALPSGTYIYRLQAADFSQSRKMLLLK